MIAFLNHIQIKQPAHNIAKGARASEAISNIDQSISKGSILLSGKWLMNFLIEFWGIISLRQFKL